MERKCSRCGEVKDISEFRLDNRKPLGRGYICKPCENEYAAKRYYGAKHEQRLVIARAYRIKHKKEACSNARRYEKKYPYKVEAKRKVIAAIKSGAIKRLPCEVCGNPKSHAHHQDYSKPLEVKWLCSVHHSAVHRKYDLTQL